MTTNKPLFRFKARVAETDLTGHYKTYWDSALNVSVLAETHGEAYKKIYKMMGELGVGSAWTVQIDSADEVMPPLMPNVEEVLDDNQ